MSSTNNCWGFQSKFILKPILQEECDIVVVYNENDKELLFDIRNLKFTENFIVKSCKAQINHDRFLFEGECELFTVQLHAQIIVEENRFIAMVQTLNVIELGLVLESIWNSCPKSIVNALNQIRIEKLLLFVQKPRNIKDEEHKEDEKELNDEEKQYEEKQYEERYILKAKISINDIFTAILKICNLDYDELQQVLKIEIFPKQFIFQPSKNSYLPFKIQFGGEENKLITSFTSDFNKSLAFDVHEDVQTKLATLGETDSFIGFEVDFHFGEMFPNNDNKFSKCIIFYSFVDSSFFISLKQIELYKEITIKECHGLFQPKDMALTAKCELFDTQLFAELIISETNIFASLFCPKIELDKIIKKIWKNCPKKMLKLFRNIHINDFELLYNKNR
eukprot:467680_1